jgi:hypothetical protein
VFSLITQGDPGAVTGLHQVSVSKWGGASAATKEIPTEVKTVDMESTKELGTGGGTNELPAKYASFVSSGLVFTVTAEGPNDFEIPLQNE